jgi:hypothetical protein
LGEDLVNGKALLDGLGNLFQLFSSLRDPAAFQIAPPQDQPSGKGFRGLL